MAQEANRHAREQFALHWRGGALSGCQPLYGDECSNPLIHSPPMEFVRVHHQNLLPYGDQMVPPELGPPSAPEARQTGVPLQYGGPPHANRP